MNVRVLEVMGSRLFAIPPGNEFMCLLDGTGLALVAFSQGECT